MVKEKIFVEPGYFSVVDVQPLITNPFANKGTGLKLLIQTDLLWVCLAVMAVHFKQLDPAQIAYAALGETDKILYIDSIKVNYQVSKD